MCRVMLSLMCYITEISCANKLLWHITHGTDWFLWYTLNCDCYWIFSHIYHFPTIFLHNIVLWETYQTTWHQVWSNIREWKTWYMLPIWKKSQLDKFLFTLWYKKLHSSKFVITIVRFQNKKRLMSDFLTRCKSFKETKSPKVLL